MKQIIITKPKKIEGGTRFGLKVERLDEVNLIRIQNYSKNTNQSIFLEQKEIDDLISALKSVKKLNIE